ncbi:Ig-like domain-containing protein [Agromyces terreus]|uniref:Ig-like domain-containing protein n=1 Tax=Agromyces terreus TaxID=424795 RepID=UPI0031DC383F
MIKKTIAMGGVACLALGLAGFAVAAPAQAAPLDQWSFGETRATGHYERTADGLHIWTEGTTSTDKVAGYLGVDLPLDEALTGGVEYTATTGIAPGAQFVVDIDDDGTPDGILVGEAVYGENWWLTGSSSAAFKALDPSGPANGGNGSEWFGTLAEWSAAAPAAHIVKVGFSLGSGVKGDGVVHAVVAGEHRYTFDGFAGASCDAPTALAPVTDQALGAWVVKDGVTPTWQSGSMTLTSTAGASAWARLTLPAGTRLADLERLSANGTTSGVYWGGIILEGGELTAQLHYDDDGRFWTSQRGILRDSSIKGGYYETRDLAADLQSNPIVETLKVYVNAGPNSIKLTSVDYGCSTQPFTKQVGPAPVIAKVLEDGKIVAGKQTFTVELQDDNISYTYIELNRGGTWLTDNTKAAGSSNSGLKPKLVIDTAAYADGAYALKINAIDKDGLSANRVVPFVIDNTKPVVTIDAPGAGAFVKGTVPVKVTLDDAHLQSYNLRIDSAGLTYAYQATNGAQPEFSLNTKTLADGVHTLLATATDKAGNKTETKTKITVDNTRPTLDVTSPAEGAVFETSTGVQVDVEASDASGFNAVVVNLYKDGTLLKSLGTQATAGAAAWAGAWTLPASLADGTYTLRVGLNDLAGNNRTVNRSIVIDSTVAAGETGDGTEEPGDGTEEPGDGTEETGDGTEETETEQPGTEEPSTALPSLAIDVHEIVRGGTVNVTGADFPAGTSVEFELHSTPVALGAVAADENGAVAFAAVVPTSTPEGAHHVVALLPDGSTVEVPITVTAADAAAAPADDASATAATDATTAGLADTGFDGTVPGLVAVAAMLLGGAAMAIMSLRRRAAVARG